MTICYLGLGSNLKSPQRQLRMAIAKLRALPSIEIIKVANFYFNKAWGRKAQPNYYNTVIAIRTRLTPQQLLHCCQAVEKQQGRVRKLHWGARTLDIDILLFGARKMKTAKLTIPHPRMNLRDFVLIPLQEIAF